MNAQEFHRLNPDFPPLEVPPLRLVDGKLIATPEENFINTYLSKADDAKTPQFLREKYWILQNPDIYPRVLDVSPRGFAKSTVYDVRDTLYDIYCRSNRELCDKMQAEFGGPNQYDFCERILLITASEDLAVDWVSQIKENVQQNERLLQAFGDVSTEGKKNGIWQSAHIKLETTSGYMEIIAFGRESAIRGKRPRKIKVDDILKDVEASNREVIMKIERWFRSVIEGCFNRIDSRLYWTATIIAPEDPVDNAFEKRDVWEKYQILRVKYPAENEEGNSIWPDMFPDKFLAFKRTQMGIDVYSAEYLCAPVALGDPIFRRDWMQKKYKDVDLPINMERVLSIDLATRTKVKNDFTHMDVIGYCFDGEHRMDFFVLDSREEKIDPDSSAKLACDLYREWNCTSMVLEVNSSQIIMGALIQREAKDKGMWINIEEVVHPNIKNVKVKYAESVSFLFKQGKGFFRDGDRVQGNLVDQMCNFPAGRHDDGVDSMVMNLRSKLEHYNSLVNDDFSDLPRVKQNWGNILAG